MQGIDRRLIQNFEWPLFTMAVLVAGIGIVNLISASPEQTATSLPDTALRHCVARHRRGADVRHADPLPSLSVALCSTRWWVLSSWCCLPVVTVAALDPLVRSTPVVRALKLAMIMLFARLFARQRPAHGLRPACRALDRHPPR
jgi:hypothetical protein